MLGPFQTANSRAKRPTGISRPSQIRRGCQPAVASLARCSRAAMTATASCFSSPVAWARPRAGPAGASAALRVGRCPAAAVAAHDVAFHPDVSRAADSLQAEFRAVDRAIALNSSRVAAAFRRARVAPHVNPPSFHPGPLLGIRAHTAGEHRVTFVACVCFSISVGPRGTATTTVAAGKRWTPSSPTLLVRRLPLCARRSHLRTQRNLVFFSGYSTV
jgi:hypothetical protein